MNMSSISPWLTEPSDYSEEAHGLSILIKRASWSGHLCGYVGVPASHPLFEQEYNSKIRVPPSVYDRPIDQEKVGIFNILLASMRPQSEIERQIEITLAFDVHGGITFSGRWPSHPDFWFFGFDCAHSGDMTPLSYHHEGDVYRTFNFVLNEARNLARQLAEAATWWPV